MKTISVIIPIYNRASCLEKTLESVYYQDFRPIELILVDNASKDASLDICHRFQKQYQSDDFRIKVIEESKRGACVARNTGFKASIGDYISFFDSDDIMYPTMLSTIFRTLTAHHEPPIVAYYADLKTKNRMERRPKHISSDAAEQLYDVVLSTHTCTIRRDYIEKIGLWEEALSRWQDLEFGFRLLLSADSLIWIKKALYLINDHEDSISGHSYTTDADILTNTLKVIQEDIQTQPEGKREKLLNALAFKMVSTAAILYQEKNKDKAAALYQQALSLSTSKKAHCVLSLHYFHTRCGGRGFWRLGRMLLK